MPLRGIATHAFVSVTHARYLHVLATSDPDNVDALGESLADRGIRVNWVNPGPTDTGYLAGVDPGMPSGRWGEVIDGEGGFRRWS